MLEDLGTESGVSTGQEEGRKGTVMRDRAMKENGGEVLSL